jgi:hypothetical protein
MLGLRARSALPWLVAATIVLTIAACSSGDDPVAPDAGPQIVWVHLAGDSTQVVLDDLAGELIDGQMVVALDRLVSTDLVPMYEDQDQVLHDARVLYSYLLVGEDGFSPHVRHYPSNTWDQLPLGYIIVSTRDVVFPDEAIDLPGAYNVKAARHLRIERKLDVATADTTYFRELADLPVTQVLNFGQELEDAVRLSDVVAACLDEPQPLTFGLTALDGFGTLDPLSWTQLQTGYWLLATGRTIFTDPELTGGRYRLRMLERIDVE